MNIFISVCESVQFMHDNKMIHRDIKPENILLDKNLEPKLCDFGWSIELKKNEKRQTFCGTYEYMAPEIFESENYFSAVDVWSLGVLLFELFHGRSPFVGNSIFSIYKNIIKEAIQFNDDFDELGKDLIWKILRLNPLERLTALEILQHPFILKNKHSGIDVVKTIENPMVSSQSSNPTFEAKNPKTQTFKKSKMNSKASFDERYLDIQKNSSSKDFNSKVKAINLNLQKPYQIPSSFNKIFKTSQKPFHMKTKTPSTFTKQKSSSKKIFMDEIKYTSTNECMEEDEIDLSKMEELESLIMLGDPKLSISKTQKTKSKNEKLKQLSKEEKMEEKNFGMSLKKKNTKEYDFLEENKHKDDKNDRVHQFLIGQQKEKEKKVKEFSLVNDFANQIKITQKKYAKKGAKIPVGNGSLVRSQNKSSLEQLNTKWSLRENSLSNKNQSTIYDNSSNFKQQINGNNPIKNETKDNEENSAFRKLYNKTKNGIMNLTQSKKSISQFSKINPKDKQNQTGFEPGEFPKKALGSFLANSLRDKSQSSSKNKMSSSLIYNQNQGSFNHKIRSSDKFLVNRTNESESNLYANMNMKSSDYKDMDHYKTFTNSASIQTEKFKPEKTMNNSKLYSTSISNKMGVIKPLISNINHKSPVSLNQEEEESNASRSSQEIQTNKNEKTKVVVKTIFSNNEINTQKIENTLKKNVNITINQYFQGNGSIGTSPKADMN